jgi:hypothetical protein
MSDFAIDVNTTVASLSASDIAEAFGFAMTCLIKQQSERKCASYPKPEVTYCRRPDRSNLFYGGGEPVRSVPGVGLVPAGNSQATTAGLSGTANPEIWAKAFVSTPAKAFYVLATVKVRTAHFEGFMSTPIFNPEDLEVSIGSAEVLDPNRPIDYVSVRQVSLAADPRERAEHKESDEIQLVYDRRKAAIRQAVKQFTEEAR